MKLKDAQWPIDGPTLLTCVRDTLTVARNSILSAAPGSFDCSGTDCDETTGAQVGENQRGGTVSLCPLWLRGAGLKFNLAQGLPEARAYALLHEFVHLSGPSAPGEKYVGQDEWRLVSFQEAQQMADAYAAVAWALGSGASATNDTPGAQR